MRHNWAGIRDDLTMREQQVSGNRRSYNRWVANQTMEDYALRFTAKSARVWSLSSVANTALGAISFLALEAIGGAITVLYGFDNAIAAIMVVSLIIFLTGLPISYYAARYGVDIDLLSRGASFGYIGSTITSLIYASFTFIFFALEAAIMASALELLFDLPLVFGYLVSSLMVIPLVTHGITAISRFQMWSQPLWLILQLIPFVFILWQEWSSLGQWSEYQGSAQSEGTGFSLLFFGAASGVLFSLVAQIGEQVDFLRFLPAKDKHNSARWWLALISAGPGWIIIGALKIMAGSFLAVLAINHGVATDLADDPIQMYLIAFSYLNQSPTATLALAGIFVVICQLKINVTNAYAGSIAWSNFFSRLTHSHPGRVVWLVFNVIIALLVMELGVYGALENILGIYSIAAVAWVGALVADLIINKPLGLSPKHIEFKRAHLYDINPVGVGAMLVSSILGISSYAGEFGELAEALAPYIALLTAFIVSPLIAFATKGRYYIARTASIISTGNNGFATCKVCENVFEAEDMASCPAYGGVICSLCCTLDARCNDQCKTDARLGDQLMGLVSVILPRRIVSQMNTRLLHLSGLLALIAGIIATVFVLVYLQVPDRYSELRPVLATTLSQLFFILLIIVGVLAWLYVLANSSRKFALDESQRQTELLSKEVNAHQRTDLELQQAKETAEAANQAKSRYLAGISHELRSPLNSILGYAQLLEKDCLLSDKHRNKVQVIRRSGDHLADLIEGMLDISRIEAGRIEFRQDQVQLQPLINELIEMFRLQAEAKEIRFIYKALTALPALVTTDGKHLRQILINLLSNAVKFTQQGEVKLTVRYRNQVAEFIISDTGGGIETHDQERIFQPFERICKPGVPQSTGTGLGLTISRLLTEIMGGEITVHSSPGVGSSFKLVMMLSSVCELSAALEVTRRITSYQGGPKTIMVVDDDADHRGLINEILSPLGFIVLQSTDAFACLDTINNGQIDLFLLDISMPQMNGWQLAELLRKRGYIAPIIMVSADAYESPEQSAREDDNPALHNDYLTKPIRDTELLAKVANALDLSWCYETADEDPHPEVPQQWAPSEQLELYCGVQEEDLRELIAMAELGFIDGMLKVLLRLDEADGSDKFVTTIRYYLERYHFSEIIALSKKGLA